MNSYLVVARTYLSRWQWRMVWLIVGSFIAFMSLMGYLQTLDSRDSHLATPRHTMHTDGDYADLLAMLVVASIMLALTAAVTSMHLRDQMANWRTKLVPQFAPPHLIVAATVLSGIVVLMAWALAYALEISPLPWVAVGFLVAALVAWCEHLQSFKLALVLLMASFAMAFPRVQEATGHFLAGERQAAAWIMLALAIPLLAALWWRSAFIHDSISGWNEPMESWHTFGWRLDRRMRFLPSIAKADFWTRIAHWQLVTQTRRTPWLLMAVAYAIIVSSLPLMDEQLRTRSLEMVLLLLAMVWLMIVPGVGSDQSFLRRNPSELMRPASRIRFVTEITLAQIVDYTYACLISFAGAMVPLVVWRNHLEWGWQQPESFAGVLVSVLAGQCLVFALLYNIPRYEWKWLGPMMRLVILCIGALILIDMTWTVNAVAGAPGLAIWSGLLLLAAFFMVLRGYLGWLEADLD